MMKTNLKTTIAEIKEMWITEVSLHPSGESKLARVLRKILKKLEDFEAELLIMLKPLKEGYSKPYVPLTVEALLKEILGDE